METVSYGNTGLQISRLCIGCGHLNNIYPDPKDAVPLLEACLDRGVNFWDTAEGYKTHPHIGEAFKVVDRSRRRQAPAPTRTARSASTRT